MLVTPGYSVARMVAGSCGTDLRCSDCCKLADAGRQIWQREKKRGSCELQSHRPEQGQSLGQEEDRAGRLMKVKNCLAEADLGRQAGRPPGPATTA